MHKVRPTQQCVPLFDGDSSMEFFDPSLDEAKKVPKEKIVFRLKTQIVSLQKKRNKSCEQAIATTTTATTTNILNGAVKTAK